MGKTTAAHGLQSITMRGIQRWGTETTISCSLASPTGGYNRGNDLFLSHTHTLCTQLHSISTLHITYNKFALSHIYTNMTFGLFTKYGPSGLSGTYSHICPFHWRRGSHWACNIRFFSFHIRRDLFPNNSCNIISCMMERMEKGTLLKIILHLILF